MTPGATGLFSPPPTVEVIASGLDFPPGGASVFKVVPGAEPEVYATGFTNIIGIAFGRDGSLYV